MSPRTVSARRACNLSDHQALKDDDAKWAALAKKPDWRIGDEVLEQRDCPRCHSTIARFKTKPRKKK